MVKKVVNAFYAHKSNLEELQKVSRTAGIIDFCDLAEESGYKFDVVKVDKGAITLIRSSDWDTANEPLIDETFTWGDVWYKGGKIAEPKVRKNGRQIYHNKWMFVSDTYSGFDIARAKKRTDVWNSIPDIKSVKNKIGNQQFWFELLAAHGIEK